METVTSGLCYIEDLIFLQNNIAWLCSSLDVQLTDISVKLYNILSYSRFFFLTAFWTTKSVWKCITKKVHNSKEIVSLQDLVVLTVSYVDIKTCPLTKYYYIIEKAYFIYRLFILFVSTYSFLLFLCSVPLRYKRVYLHSSIGILL